MKICPMRYLSMESPLGELFLAAFDGRLYRIAWETSEATFAAELEAIGDLPAQRDTFAGGGVLRQAETQLREYFAGCRREFDLPLDITYQTPFQRQVLAALRQVPYGEVVSY